MRLRTILLASVAGFTVAETLRPLRRRVEPQPPRAARNLVLAGLSAAVTAALQTPLMKGRRRGLLQRMRMPPAMRRVAAVLLLDYTLWWWHRANHEVPFLWRFHRVHHADRDLDVSTALRFHFGEMALAALFRAAQVHVIGADDEAVELWQKMLLPSIVFHHSNFDLSEEIDRMLACVLVTPRMHGIHHSVVKDSADTNYSSLLTFWDTLHGTMRLDVPQDAITIGAPDQPDDVSLKAIVALPFRTQPT